MSVRADPADAVVQAPTFDPARHGLDLIRATIHAVATPPELTSFGRLTGEALRTLFAARGDLARLGGEALEPEHLLLALLRPESGSAHEALRQLHAPIDAIRAAVEATVARPQGVVDAADLPLGPHMVAIIERAHQRDGQITSRELLGCLLGLGTGPAAAALRAHGLTEDAIRTA